MNSVITKPIPEMIRSRLAYAVCGPSISRALRKGAKNDVIPFFNQLDLSHMANCSKEEFEKWLDTTTSELETLLRCFVKEPEGKPFGYARKLINLFLRDLFYDYRCRKHFRVSSARLYLEVPVDRHVARGLRKEEPNVAPPWNQLRNLNRDEHSKYQDAASLVAKRRNLARVDVDLLFWPPASKVRGC